MNQRLLALVCAVFVVGIFYKYSLRSMVPPSSSSPSFITTGPVVTLVSSDGKKFHVAQQVVQNSDTISHMIDDFGINTPLPLPGLKAKSLSRMISIMHDLLTVINSDNYVIDTCARRSNHYVIMIAHYASYLQINELTKSLIRFYIFRKLRENPTLTKDALMQSLRSNFLKQEIHDEYDFVKTSAGFVALDEPIYEGFLDLQQRGITNVYGLSLVKNKEALDTLSLGSNRITDLPAGAFQGFPNMQKLYLPYNQLTQLHPEAFQGLSNLKKLYLVGNPFNPPLTEEQVRAMLPNDGQGVKIQL